MRVAIIVQARMSSTRLPGKILLRVLNKPLLQYLIERLRRVGQADDLILATSTELADDRLVEFCRQHDLSCVRGEENDVLARYHSVLEQHPADAVVRITADCPLIDPSVVDSVIKTYRDHSGTVDYVANTLERTFPRGMDCEVISARVLSQTHREATEEPEREHVTMFIYRHPERFRLLNVAYGSDQSRHRWTVDTPEDFELVRRIIESLYPSRPEFSLEDCLALLKRNPDWININRDVSQKTE